MNLEEFIARRDDIEIQFYLCPKIWFWTWQNKFLQGLAVLAGPNPKPIEVWTNLSLDSSEFWVRPLQ